MKKNFTKIITIIAIILICILSAKKVFQNDTFYSIKLGESILKNGVDFIDHFSWHNLAYTYPHWLYTVIIYLIYSINGYKSLYIFNIIIYIILSIVFYFVNLKISKEEGIVSIVSLVFCIMISSFVVVRAQSITYILFLLEILCIKQLLNKGKNIYGILLLLIALLICNMHSAVYPLFFILFLPFIAEYIITKIKWLNNLLNKKLSVNKEKYFKKLIIFMILGLFVGLLTPIKDMPYTYYIRTVQSGSQKFILEHQTGLTDLTTICTLSIVLLLSLLFIFKSKEKIKITDLFMILGLTLMVAMSKRHFALYIILGLVSLTNMFVLYLKNDHKLMNMLFNSKVFLVIVTIEIPFIASFIYMNESKKDFVDKEMYPVEALEYLKNNYDLEDKKIFNDYETGSYILLNDVKVFVDSRCDLYLKAFNGYRDIFYDALMIRDANKELLEYYDFDFTLTKKKDLINQLICNYDNYENIYEDDYFVIYKKK